MLLLNSLRNPRSVDRTNGKRLNAHSLSDGLIELHTKPALNIVSKDSNEDVGSCASILRVLADETLLAVVEQLLDGPWTVSGINDVLGVEPILLSHHLKAFREAQIVTTERVGRYVSYLLSPSLLFHRRGWAIGLGCGTISFS